MTTSWIRVASIAELDDAGGLLGCSVGGVPIALYSVEGEYFATADTCTHGQARLSDGYLEGHLIECPLHQGLFDIRTGEVKGPPCTKAIRTVPVRERDGALLVGVEPAQGDAARAGGTPW
jgi:naphthalene 1,2-dioxygenase ferredoxin component